MSYEVHATWIGGYDVTVIPHGYNPGLTNTKYRYLYRLSGLGWRNYRVICIGGHHAIGLSLLMTVYISVKFNCAGKISESLRQQIHSDFWQQSDDGKACFYAQTVTRHTKWRHRNKGEDESRRYYSYVYRLYRVEQLVWACKVFYLTTLNVSQWCVE